METLNEELISLLSKQYNFTRVNNTVIIELKNKSDFPYKIVSEENVYNLYQMYAERNKERWNFIRLCKSEKEALRRIIVRHNKSAEYLRSVKRIEEI